MLLGHFKTKKCLMIFNFT